MVVTQTHSRSFEFTPPSTACVKFLLVFHCSHLFVFHCNCRHILYRFRDKAKYWSKIATFFILPSTQPMGINGCKYHPAVFSQSSQISGLASDVNRLCKKSSIHSQLRHVTDRHTDGNLSDLSSRLYYVMLAKNQCNIQTWSCIFQIPVSSAKQNNSTDTKHRHEKTDGRKLAPFLGNSFSVAS